MQTQQVIERMAQAGSSCERVDDHVVRCTRRYDDNKEPYAIYYIDLHGDIPGSDDAVLGFQEKYLADQFFKGPRHLRWNHYVVFVVENKKWADVEKSALRRRIELDTTYARKLVLPERDFDAFAATHEEVFTGAAKPDDPTIEWRKTLRASGLEGVVFARNREPTINAWIEGSWKPGKMAPQFDTPPAPQEEDGKRLHRVTWDRFREWPEQRDFSFGAVNLISGVNGTGKTSLLEAIECYFCGENRRNGPPRSGTRDIKGILEGQTELSSLEHTPGAKRQRDLRWFGAYFRGTDDLVANFNRYLFFNADSAFHLEHADRGKFVSDALARIALGPAAMDLWGRMKEFHKEFQSQVAQLDRQARKSSSEVASVKAEVDRLKKLALASEKKLDALRNSMEQAGWRSTPSNYDEFEDRFLSGITDAFERTECLEDLKPPTVSLSDVRREAKNIGRRLEQALQLDKQLARVATTREKLSNSIEDLEQRFSRIARLQAYVEAGWLESTQHASSLDEQIQQVSTELETLAEVEPEFSSSDRAQTLRDLSSAIAVAIKQATGDVAKQSSVLAEQKQRLSALEHVLAEASALGRRMVDLDPDASECPLCGQDFGKGQLAKAISRRGSSKRTDTAAAAASLKSVSDLEKLVETSLRKKAGLEAYSVFEDAMRKSKRIAGSPTLGDLQSLEAQRRSELANLRKSRQQMRQTISKLGQEGFRSREFDDLATEVLGDGATTDSQRASARLSALRGRLKEKLDETRKALATEKASERSLQSALSTVLQRPSKTNGYETAIAHLTETQELLTSVLESTSALGKTLKISDADDLRSIRREIVVTYGIANDMSESISSERARISTVTKLEERYLALGNEDRTVRAKKARAEEATKAFEKLFKTLSLDLLVARFVDSNRPRISNILNAIHAPREFTSVAPLEEEGTSCSLRLVRSNGKLAELSEVSAGQRTAMALSVFLALNEGIQSAPPIILMDDPVAHVDDLNMLAFLDLIREIAGSGKRQLFFATADSKLAGIFEQKFHAFGDSFKNHPLQRSAP